MHGTNEGGPEQKKQGIWKAIVFLVVIVGLIVLSRMLGLGEKLGELRGWIASLGTLGPLVFVGFYTLAVIAAIPGSAITIAAGALFGSVMGTVWVSIGSTLGASLAFIISRYLARNAVVGWLSSNEKFMKLDKLTEDHGAIIVALTRLVPVFPFNLLNYGFGLTGVPFWTYVFWSWLCMLPGTVLYVVGADALAKGITQGRIPWVLMLTLLMVIILLTLIVGIARKKLRNREGGTYGGGKSARDP